jgi:hypothetical protein
MNRGHHRHRHPRRHNMGPHPAPRIEHVPRGERARGIHVTALIMTTGPSPRWFGVEAS